jgi:hypothetical protein
MQVSSEINTNSSGREPGSFLIRWRGKQEGPYTVSLIETKLAANQIGLLHEIFYGGQWITLRDYFAEQDALLRAEQQAKEKQEKQAREEAERQTRELEAQQRAAALVEEKRKNDLLAAELERQSNASHTIPHTQIPLRPHRGGTILALALIGLFVFGVLCLIAWVMGSADLREMDAGTMDPSGRSTTSSGRNIGILGTILWAAGVFFLFSH